MFSERSQSLLWHSKSHSARHVLRAVHVSRATLLHPNRIHQSGAPKLAIKQQLKPLYHIEKRRTNKAPDILIIRLRGINQTKIGLISTIYCSTVCLRIFKSHSLASFSATNGSKYWGRKKKGKILRLNDFVSHNTLNEHLYLFFSFLLLLLQLHI